MPEDGMACPICGGELHDDLADRGWLTCFRCAHSLQLHPALAAGGRRAPEITDRSRSPRPSGPDRHWPPLGWHRRPRLTRATLPSSEAAFRPTDWLVLLALGLAVLAAPLLFDLAVATGLAR